MTVSSLTRNAGFVFRYGLIAGLLTVECEQFFHSVLVPVLGKFVLAH